ncbi:anthranilate phosphoribosyltransferase [Hydrogenovibrio sp. 3SP14C1]|uniref:anthranilate phosphoribosyltransferase n=1 Tax=Hydrogenovibrio sp. 3SP14C1 TaxID=3038774 RepID=UPI00241807BC|nr:anthranilate phosphoribosyltransferase [Hydrogenovibrio sp. 3SP14C1]MDG4812135.1 anthranilate phosphoribosyltransferase [Hydrogenovibrio sp. 3SP14C1]
MQLRDALEQLLNKQDLTAEQMEWVMQMLMSGQATSAQIAAILVALRAKGETVEEITAAASVMRSLATQVDLADKTHMVDTCGTGGDGANTFNISTASAFVAAAAGAKVAKHGSRSVSSQSGSADLLEKAGVNLNLTPEQVAECVETVGVGFMYAPAHHSAMKHVIGVRKEIGVRTLFNILGPLTNPAQAPAQVLGVYDSNLLMPFAQVLRELGSKHVMIVHAQDGLDEISIASLTEVAELKEGAITQWTLDPSEYDADHPDLSDLKIDSAQDSLNIIHAVLANDHSAAADIVCLNAGASIYVSGVATSYAEGVQMAKNVIANGQARELFNQFIQKTQSFA